ncbi:MAG: Hsp20/alpha crystallin family protein [Elusimicrobia bacterium]|nr:Hsp20/alpha crystallin family protein [Elusimicrobiota bacterium]
MKKDRGPVNKTVENASALSEFEGAVVATCEPPVSSGDLVSSERHHHVHDSWLGHHHHICAMDVEDGVCMPPMDMEQTEREYVISVEMPGITKKDVSVAIRGGVLAISGRRAEAEDSKDYLVRERSSGSFQRSLILPEGVKSKEARASYIEGVLKVVLPKCRDTAAGNCKVDVC